MDIDLTSSSIKNLVYNSWCIWFFFLEYVGAYFMIKHLFASYGDYVKQLAEACQIGGKEAELPINVGDKFQIPKVIVFKLNVIHGFNYNVLYNSELFKLQLIILMLPYPCSFENRYTATITTITPSFSFLELYYGCLKN